LGSTRPQKRGLEVRDKELEVLRVCKEQEIQAKIVSDLNEMVASLKKEMLERDSWQGENE